MTVATNADDKLNELTDYSLSRLHLREFYMQINELCRAFFASTNSSLAWIGTAASHFCFFYASYLPQKTPRKKVCHLVEQKNVVRKLEIIGTVMSYPRPNESKEYAISVLVLQMHLREMHVVNLLGVLTGFILGEFKNESIFHALSWLSRKSKRPLKSVPTAENLDSAKAIDESNSIAHDYSEILHTEFGIHLCVDSKD